MESRIDAALGVARVAAIALALAGAWPADAAPVAPAPQGRYAEVNGIRMYYELRGEGPVLVLLHGGAGSGEQFGRQVPAFEHRFRLVVPDMCAQGRTTDRPGPLTYHAMAEDVIALMNRLNVSRFDVMGWSDGGVTGLDLAIHHPDRVRRLVTFGANSSPDGLNPADVAWNDTATVAAFGDGMREGWTRRSPQPDHYEAAMQKILVMWKTLPRFTPAELHSIRAGVLVCAGEHDLIRPEHTQALANAIPGAQMWIVPGASHGAIQEKPEDVNARVIGFLAAGDRGAAAAPRATAWEVHALRYATIPAFPVRYLVAGADTSRTLDIAMMFWLLKGSDGRRVLVDAGFYRQKFLDSWKPAGFVRPSEAVRRFGIPPDSITDVIVTHVHWDHLDGADLFPGARVWIQRAEYEYYVGADGTPLRSAIDTLDAGMLATLREAGRVKLVEGDAQEIMPGVTAYTGGKHTFASQYVGVRTAKGTVVLASDNLYLYENLDRRAAIAQTLDAQSNLAAQDRMKKIASALRLIVPGHDPAVFERFHGVGQDAVKIE